MWLAPFPYSWSGCWKRILLEISFFISKVPLGLKKQNTVQDVLTVHLVVVFDAFINKSKWYFSSWTNLTTKTTEWNFCFLSVITERRRTFFERIRLWIFLINFAIDHEPASLMLSILKACVFVGDRKILALLPFSRLVSKKKFRNSLNNFLADVHFFPAIFIKTFKMRLIIFAVTLRFLEILTVRFLTRSGLPLLWPNCGNYFTISNSVYLGTSKIRTNSHCLMPSGYNVRVALFGRAFLQSLNKLFQ